MAQLKIDFFPHFIFALNVPVLSQKSWNAGFCEASLYKFNRKVAEVFAEVLEVSMSLIQ